MAKYNFSIRGKLFKPYPPICVLFMCYFQVGIIITKNKRAEKLTDLSGKSSMCAKTPDVP